MKKAGPFMLFMLLLLLCGAVATAEEAEAATDEWTVMFYFCGSDLESRYGYATGNLEEIYGVHYPDNYLSQLIRNYGVEPAPMTEPGRVNILIETGGSSEWHAGDLRMDIAADALQRWRYNVYPWGGQDSDGPIDSYELMQTLPSASMADPETLADFIRWGKATCPAKKYALVLWGHGDGARSGLLIDELFGKDAMYLYELKQALSDADTHLEAVIIDACLMASLETAWTLKDSAAWMVASEEYVPGKGTAVGSWLQQLLYNPWCDGKWLCRCVCDTTAVKYAQEQDTMYSDILTWSVVDLSKTDALMDGVRRFFENLGEALKNYPGVANLYMRYMFNAEELGDGLQNMRDFGAVVYNEGLPNFMDLGLRSDVIQALSDAVAYSVSGPAHSGAKGLTFCYPADFSDEQLDNYAKSFPMPAYLAYIDAVTPWTAPDWVYASTGRLPELDSIEELRIVARKSLAEDGMPSVEFGDSFTNVDEVYYRLYRLDEVTGETVLLGRTNCVLESDEELDLLWRAADPMHWPAIDGELICMDLIQVVGMKKLYNVPVMIDGQNCILRCGRNVNYATDAAFRINDYDIFGVWEGTNETGDLMNRSLKPLALVAGQEYRLLYPIDIPGSKGRVTYRTSAPLTMYRRLDVTEVPLPAGTYYLEYEIDDVFMRRTVLDRIEIRWDGENMTFPGEPWQADAWFDLKEIRNRQGTKG